VEDPTPTGAPGRADFEIGTRWTAKRVRREGSATVRTATSGAVDRSEELNECEPNAPEGWRWRLRAWLRPRADRESPSP
jgi:hypothetical protein